MPFKPHVSSSSSRLVENRRRNNGTDQASIEERCVAVCVTPETTNPFVLLLARCTFLSNEKSMWGQRREALERRKEAEEMSKCTFTPNINPSSSNRKIPKGHYMKPLRKNASNALSTEEREVVEHCTFQPKLNRKAGRVGANSKRRPLAPLQNV